MTLNSRVAATTYTQELSYITKGKEMVITGGERR